MSEQQDERTYEIVTAQETLRITIPASYKVTYGALHPGTKGGYSIDGNVLRIYENDTKQRAVFQNVRSFRDLSLPLERQVVATKEKTKDQRDGKGNNEFSRETEVTASWERL